MKKLLSIIIAACLVIGALSLSSCSAKNTDKSEKTGKIDVVTTIFPIYDWVQNVAGDDVHLDLSLLMSNGVDLHNFQPTADDIIKISSCDVFIYVGGESDKWVDDTLKSAQNKNMKVINLMDVLGESAKEEEVVEGMQEEDEEGGEDESSAPEYDEHIWLSLENAEKCVKEIANAFAEVDREDASYYYANSKTYCDSLAELDVKYSEAVKNAKNKTLIFADRFPFRYLTDDYDLDYYAAFVGCSAETEASFETVQFLAKKTDELSLGYIMVLENSDNKIANTVIKNTKNKNQKIVALNSMQGISEEDIKSGKNYLGIMQENLETLKTVLN